MRIYRLLGLLSVLAEVEHITVQELAVRFEVSRRTILRDIDTLNEAGFPVASRPGRGGGVSILKGYRQDKRLLSREDIASLFTALDGLKGLVGDGSVSALLARLVPVQRLTHAPAAAICLTTPRGLRTALPGKSSLSCTAQFVAAWCAKWIMCQKQGAGPGW